MSFEIPIPADCKIETLPIILLQFSFSNSSLVPNSLKILPQDKTSYEERKKMEGLNGVQIISSQENIEAQGFINDLQREGYILIRASAKERPGANGKKAYMMVRFIFALEDSATTEIKNSQKVLLSDLRLLLKMAYWRIRAYRNYSLEQGFFGSLNFESRVPRYDGENTDLPVLSRKKDANGRKIGAPVALEPSGHLRIRNNELTIDR